MRFEAIALGAHPVELLAELRHRDEPLGLLVAIVVFDDLQLGEALPGACRLPRVAQPRLGLPLGPHLLFYLLAEGVGVLDEAQGKPTHPLLKAFGAVVAVRAARPPLLLNLPRADVVVVRPRLRPFGATVWPERLRPHSAQPRTRPKASRDACPPVTDIAATVIVLERGSTGL